MLVGALEARAATITIDKAETQTNGGQMPTEGGGDTIIVTKDGSITSKGLDFDNDFVVGIQANSRNTITNNGSINTESPRVNGWALGIRAVSRNIITNNGSINIGLRRVANLDFGIVADIRNTITNNGSINVTATFSSYGIKARNHNTITNEAGASISVWGMPARSAGILAGDHNTITNSGDMSSSRISAGDRNTITNSGDMSNSGISAGRYNTITNSGDIGGISVGRATSNHSDTIYNINSNTISNSNGGNISTKGRDQHHSGIFAWGSLNTIHNEAGAHIRTEGAGARGIMAGLSAEMIQKWSKNGHNTIRNDGEIQTAGAGIQVLGKNNTVTNTGAIRTSGEGAAGILAVTYDARINLIPPEPPLRATDTALANTGSITTTGASAPGIQVEDKAKITHSGRIQVSGPGSAGILAVDENELRLSGSITSAQDSALHLGNNNTVYHCRCGALTSSGENTPAVRLGSNNTLSNWGTIEATGTGAEAHAITGGGGNTINNDGIIKANPAGAGKAIAFTGSGNTLNLGPNSRITGDIDLGADGRQNQVAKIDDAPCGEACRAREKQKRVTKVVDPNPVKPNPVKPNQVKVSQAPAISMLWDGITARPAKSSEGAPFFYNAQTRQLATYDTRALAASAGALGDASANVGDLMARPGLESAANRRSLIPMASGSAFWLRTFGNRARYRGRGNLNPEAGHLALAAGYDLRFNATQFGVLAGYGRGELRFEGAERFKPGPSLFKGPFAGVYVRQDLAPFSVQLGLAGGALRHASSRLVNDNRAPNGLARAEARTRSWWLAPEARIGLRLDAGLMQFEPSFKARYARQSIRGFTEAGIRAPATVGQRKVELVETRLELKTGREVGPGRIALKAGWQYRDDLNSSQARVRMLGESQRVRLESGLGSSFYLGAEAEFELAPGLFLNLSGEAVSGDGYRNMSGMVSVYKAF